jgi:hypothetical protein
MWSQAAAPAPPWAPVEPPAPEPVLPVAPAVDVQAELVRLVEAVTAMCDRVIEYVDADRAERHLMIEVLTTLTGTMTATETARAADAERVIGGSMPTGPEPMIDLRERETAVEVRCRFGERWVDGFEIFEVLHNDTGIRYRLRRRIDGVVLPEVFGAADIRHVETFEELASTPHQRYWSPL